MRPLRILDLRDTHEIGGPGKTILETYRAIDATRFSLQLAVFLTRHETDDSPFINAARQYGLPVHLLRGFNQYDPGLIWQVVSLVKTLEIDIIHAHEVKSDVITYLASRLRRVPIVTTLHGWIGNRVKDRLMTAIDRQVLRGFDCVIAVSGQIEMSARAAGVTSGRLRLLHNGIVVERYRRTGERGFLATLIGRPVPGPVIVSIGRLSREKGHADLVEALGLAKLRGCAVTAILVGDGPERPQLLKRVQQLGLEDSVHLPGYVDETRRILEETDLMVLPSHTEGLPNAALEALAMEVPVLATRVGGTPEVIADGDTGRLVEARSPEALAAALADFVAEPAPWKAMAKRGRLVVETRFNFETRTRLLEQIYVETARGNG